MSYDAQNPFNYVTAQPESRIGVPPGSVQVNGVTVRNLTDTDWDAEFAGRLTVEAFRGKFAHCVTERKLPIAVKNMTAYHRGQGQAFYNRAFVAELEGRPVGFLQIKFKGDTEIDKDDHISELGCWHAIRYGCLGLATSFEVDKNYKCYLDHICVDESARGKGVGKVLMQRAEYEARARNCSIIYLYVLTTNRARNLYEREGYRVTDTSTGCGCLGCCIGPPGEMHEMQKTLL
ncbi:uncharacterized protein LOC123552723 [Mercenaria mercenaria]|uniref:uncharacterized protein LOC123552723 n=1 Tax=Mercenaria mercenaria TaxID=6596 RepID=UPI00234E9FDC|nr:uncharacterized protein LOC123552723 [Mercenaria mercenaria]XP_053396633.1 uncharacterized protein LOC123552723 [Mercenaria mercenaria]